MSHPVESIQANVGLHTGHTPQSNAPSGPGIVHQKSALQALPWRCPEPMSLWPAHLQLTKQQEEARLAMLGNLYGSALPARMNIERQILRRCCTISVLQSTGCSDLTRPVVCLEHLQIRVPTIHRHLDLHDNQFV